MPSKETQKKKARRILISGIFALFLTPLIPMVFIPIAREVCPLHILGSCGEFNLGALMNMLFLIALWVIGSIVVVILGVRKLYLATPKHTGNKR